MKSYFVVSILLAFSSINLLGQSVPGFFNYQLAVRNASGEILRNRSMSFEIYITENPNENDPKKFLFHERHDDKRTNNVGVASFQIGGGQKQNNSKDLSKIKFLNKELYINVAVDTNNGSQFSLVSTTQLISVPYAFVADTSNFALIAKDMSQSGASEGQVLKWNQASNSWKPGNDIGGGTGDDWGSQSVAKDNSLKGDGTSSNPLGMAQQGAEINQVLKWNGTVWKPADDIGGGNGDKWGDQVVQKDKTLKGSGTSLDSLGLAQQGAMPGQVLKWDGNSWSPNNEESVVLFAGNGIKIINNNQIENIGDINSSDDITTSTNAKGDLSGTFPDLNLIKLHGNPISLVNPTLNQVLAWNGTEWQPKTISDLNLIAGNGISIINNTISNVGDINAQDDLTKTSNASGDVSGSFDGLTVKGIFGRPISKLIPSKHNILQYDGTSWVYELNNYNTAIGSSALFSNKESIGNTSLGFSSLNLHYKGDYNIAIGYESLLNDIQGDNNVSIGYKALFRSNNSAGNTSVGNSTLGNIYNGKFNTALGYMANTSISDLNSTVVIGATALITANSNVRIGNTGITRIEGQVAWAYPSDGRFKENIKNNIPGLSFIRNLRPVSYTLNNDKMLHYVAAQMPDSIAKLYYPSEDQIRYDQQKIKSGFIAQEVEQLAKDIGYDFDGINAPQNETDTYSIAYSQFVPSIVKAIQEQQVLIESQEKTISELKKELVNMNQLELIIQKMQKEMTELKEKINK